MTAPHWVYETVERFWQWAGGDPEVFPRDLRWPIARAFALSPVALPNLRVRTIDRWLELGGIACSVGVADRPLRACLVAFGGVGTVFLDSEDPTSEQRFSLAHELAHFLHDYVEPRLQAAQKLGPDILDVLDGRRPPTQQEKLKALLARAPIGFVVHLMERDNDGSMNTQVHAVEASADRLAYELLAPEDRVLAVLGDPHQRDARERTVALLQEHFDLPFACAAHYARMLVPVEKGPTSFLGHLRLVK